MFKILKLLSYLSGLMVLFLLSSYIFIELFFSILGLGKTYNLFLSKFPEGQNLFLLYINKMNIDKQKYEELMKNSGINNISFYQHLLLKNSCYYSKSDFIQLYLEYNKKYNNNIKDIRFYKNKIHIVFKKFNILKLTDIINNKINLILITYYKIPIVIYNNNYFEILELNNNNLKIELNKISKKYYNIINIVINNIKKELNNCKNKK